MDEEKLKFGGDLFWQILSQKAFLVQFILVDGHMKYFEYNHCKESRSQNVMT